jgi:hypothetical protein
MLHRDILGAAGYREEVRMCGRKRWRSLSAQLGGTGLIRPKGGA